jgi:hypothetical protein
VTLRATVEEIRALPYGRPSDRTVEGMLRERRGTCSTKHLHLARVLADRYLTAVVEGRRITIDATFPDGEPWDGSSPMPLACGPGDDHPAGADPDGAKRALEAAHCDPAVREPFIAALSG